MPIISVRVNEETKRAIDSHKDVKWSEVIRERIKERLEEEEARKVDRKRLLMAVKVTDRLRRRSPSFDSTREIRRWREARR